MSVPFFFMGLCTTGGIPTEKRRHRPRLALTVSTLEPETVLDYNRDGSQCLRYHLTEMARLRSGGAGHFTSHPGRLVPLVTSCWGYVPRDVRFRALLPTDWGSLRFLGDYVVAQIGVE